jgi:hypothetical protein
VSGIALRRDAVILACAISAGVHGALAPGHFAEGAAAGAGFAVATVLLALLAAALTWRAADLFLAAAVLVFAGLIVSYALAATTGVPLLHPEPEPVDSLGLATKAFEAAGLVAASSLLRPRRTAAPAHPQTKGTPA